MFYRNALKGLSGRDRVFSVKSFGGGMNTVSEDFLVGENVAKISYNLTGRTGALRECGGFSAFTLPFDGSETEVTIGGKAIIKVWYYKRFDNPTRKTTTEFCCFRRISGFTIYMSTGWISACRSLTKDSSRKRRRR